jgi:redox-sensitive bicupin YhaK (pirin superfamily)
MQPEAFEWRSVAKGLSEKPLGRFTEDVLFVSHYRLDPEGVLRLPADRTHLLWVISGEIEHRGERYERATAIFSDFGEATELTAPEIAEAVVLGLPLATDRLI